ncbi:disease resistance protein RPP13 isoform X2 [Sorghum bicolor]|uniref:disease resistance protein RPP13 isoform X2 n=1 Tax=Sorghum bicolor TaxID=4558 RepID=UPI000B423E5B|nr:disease resistance protein RPP13 isoform X2 [Sorghum bicolor]|eukprot:XP_021317024.1 disease resistance protein RPP13 isoform X2 [Sorghum bicolor]
MAVVLDALASYLQDMLVEMVEEEVHLLLGVPDEIEKMGIKLGDLKRFLADADKRNIRDETVQSWVRELRNAMYDATNILDLCQLNAMERGPTKDMGCFNPLLFCIRNPLYAHDIGNRIKSLNKRLDDIEKRSKAFNFNLASYEDNTRMVESSLRARRETTGEDEFGVVGVKIEEDTRSLVDLLIQKEKNVHEHKNVMVYAIVGVGGIGKTTLAKKIFNHDFIKQEYEKRIWLSVNKEFNDIDLLERAITEAQGDLQAARNTKAALERTLKEALKGCKTLLVMDDVWDPHVWEKVLEPPLINSLARGSRVLVTTRHDMVARGMTAEVPYHHVKKLEHEDAWSLLKKQVRTMSIHVSYVFCFQECNFTSNMHILLLQ